MGFFGFHFAPYTMKEEGHLSKRGGTLLSVFTNISSMVLKRSAKIALDKLLSVAFVFPSLAQ